jgi:hypothetical protein
MPGPTKAGFGVVVLNGKLLVMAGHSLIDGTGTASADVYEYDCCLNRFVFCQSWVSLSLKIIIKYIWISLRLISQPSGYTAS